MPGRNDWHRRADGSATKVITSAPAFVPSGFCLPRLQQHQHDDRLFQAFAGLLDPRQATRLAIGRIAQLTARERDVLKLMTAGLNNAEIAALLILAQATI